MELLKELHERVPSLWSYTVERLRIYAWSKIE
jgi:hypothetical protein